MRFFYPLLLVCNMLQASDIFSSQEDLEHYKVDIDAFYETYITEQRVLLDELGIGGGGTVQTAVYTPPPNPPPPAFVAGHLPIVLVNRSGYPDSQVYFLITGKNLSSINCWGNINSSGVATLQPVQNGDNSTTYMVPLSSLPRSSTGRVAYVPQTISGLCWFSIGSPLSMGVLGGGIVQPNPTTSSDPNYYTVYDLFEYDFQAAGSPQISCDATAVSFFSIPQYGYLEGATSKASNTGLYQPRSYIMAQVAKSFNAAPLKNQWNKLILSASGKPLRILSTMKSMSIPSFDSNYLDDAAAYGYSYIENIWDGASSFYRDNDCKMTVTVTDPSTATYDYVGRVGVSDEFEFTSTNGGPAVTFLAPVAGSTQTLNTSYLIFAAQNLTVAGGASQPTAGTADDAVSKLFEEAVIAGLVPTTNTLSLDYLSANQANYYKTNTSLSSTGQASGPWYDLYSKALHSLGSIYTYGFDEPLWPNVLLTGPFQENATYLGITIGNCE